MFTLGITNTENDAFTSDPTLEIARILRVVADKLHSGYTEGVCIDANGNKVGEWGLSQRHPGLAAFKLYASHTDNA